MLHKVVVLCVCLHTVNYVSLRSANRNLGHVSFLNGLHYANSEFGITVVFCLAHSLLKKELNEKEVHQLPWPHAYHMKGLGPFI